MTYPSSGSQIKAIEYYPNGQVKRVEYFEYFSTPYQPVPWTWTLCNDTKQFTTVNAGPVTDDGTGSS